MRLVNVLLILGVVGSSQGAQVSEEGWRESANLTAIGKQIDSQAMAIPPRNRPAALEDYAKDAFDKWKAKPSDKNLALWALLYRGYVLTDQIAADLPKLDTRLIEGKAFTQEYELSRAVYLNEYHQAPLSRFKDLRSKLLAKDGKDLLVLLAASFDEGWKGDQSKGIELGHRAAKLEPGNYLVYHRIAVGHHYRFDKVHDRNDAAAAIRNYEEFLRLGPQDNWRAASVKNRIQHLRKQ